MSSTKDHQFMMPMFFIMARQTAFSAGKLIGKNAIQLLPNDFADRSSTLTLLACSWTPPSAVHKTPSSASPAVLAPAGTALSSIPGICSLSAQTTPSVSRHQDRLQLVDKEGIEHHIELFSDPRVPAQLQQCRHNCCRTYAHIPKLRVQTTFPAMAKSIAWAIVELSELQYHVCVLGKSRMRIEVWGTDQANGAGEVVVQGCRLNKLAAQSRGNILEITWKLSDRFCSRRGVLLRISKV